MEKERHFIGWVPPFGDKTPGVYRYTHMETGKVYIGSTVNGYGRFIQHTTALERGGHGNWKFQRAFNQSPFFEVAFSRLPPAEAKGDPLVAVRRMEQTFIDNTDPSKLLNLATDVFASGLSRSPSPETREKLSQALRGRFVSEETRRRRSETLKGVSHTPERKENISTARTKHAVRVGDVVYKNVQTAADALGFANKGSVRFRCLSDAHPEFQFMNKDEFGVQLGNSPSL